MSAVPRWSTLRTIGSSRLAQATVFIPIVGYLFVFNNEIVSFLKLIPIFVSNGEAKGEIQDVNLSRIISIYIGLFCIGIGSILFAALCPSEIAENADEHEFILKELDVMTPFRFELIRQRLLTLRHIASRRLLDEMDRLAAVELSDVIGLAGARTTELGARGLLWTDWLNRNKSNLTSVISVQYQLLVA
jgi:hypothetical protein